MKKLGLFVLSFVIIPFSVGCGEKNPTPDPDDETYTITWLNYDDSVLEVDKYVKKGEMPHYDGDAPTKPDDDTYFYTFSGWEPELKPVTSSQTYKATFIEDTITKIDIDIPDVGSTYKFGFFYQAKENADIKVDWGDGTVDGNSDHNYEDHGEYHIKIKNIANLSFAKSSFKKDRAAGASFVYKADLGTSITSINDYAFYRCNALTSVTFSENVTTIGDYAFSECPELTKIEIPKNVNHIGVNAFETCEKVETITVNPENEVYNSSGNCNAIIETATNTLLCGCIKTIIPENVTTIGDYAFAYLPIIEINIPKNVTSIGKNAFIHCTSLESITVDEENKVYDSRNDCNALIRKDTNTLVLGCKTTVIPSGVTAIGDYAFYYCSPEEIDIPNGVTSIGEGAFYHCDNLKRVTIPNSIKFIGPSCFDASLNLDYKIYENAKYLGNNSNEYAALIAAYSPSITECTISENCKVVASGAFEYCSKLTSITIPASVVSVGVNAFENCKLLENMDVNQENAIYDSRNDCNAIIETATNTLVYGCMTTTIPNDVTAIGDYAFHRSSIAKIVIPSSVTSIGEGAFYWCSKLATVNLRACSTPPALGKYAFHEPIGVLGVKFYIANETTEQYLTAENWNEYDPTQFKEEDPPVDYFFQSNTCSSFFKAV